MQKRRSRTERLRDSSFDVRSPMKITLPTRFTRFADPCRRMAYGQRYLVCTKTGLVRRFPVDKHAKEAIASPCRRAWIGPPGVITWNDNPPENLGMQGFAHVSLKVGTP